MKRNIVVSAILTIMLCVSLITGATFALFTSESKVNVAVTSGKVSVVAEAREFNLSSTLGAGKLPQTHYDYVENDGENTVELSNIVPGDKLTFKIIVTNKSNVTVQYRTILACVEDEGLFEALEVTIDGTTYNGTTAVSNYEQLEPSDEWNKTVNVSVYLPETAGNNYQDKTCTISYTVEAKQGNAVVEDPDDDTVYIYNAFDLVNFAKGINNNTLAANYTKVEFISDVDMNGKAWTPVTLNRNLTINGNEKTIKNLTINASAPQDVMSGTYALIGFVSDYNLTIKELYMNKTLVNAAGEDSDVSACMVGFVQGGSNISLLGCKLTDCTIGDTKYASGFIGYSSTSGNVYVGDDASNGIGGCSVENCAFYGNDATGAVIGLNQGKTEMNNVMVTNNTIDGGAGYSAAALVGTANSEEMIATDVTVSGNTYSIDTVGKDGLAVVDSSTYGFDYGYFYVNSEYSVNGTAFVPQTTFKTVLNAGDNITLQKNYILTDGWTSFGKNNNSSHYANAWTLDGNGKFIAGLSKSLLVENFGQGGVTIKNLTVKDSVVEASTPTGTANGVLVSHMNGFDLTIENCHLNNVTVKGADDNLRVGGFVGQSDVNNLSITGCTVTGCTILGDSSAGGVVGMVTGGAGKTMTITNCKVKDTTIQSNDKGDNYGTESWEPADWRIGAIVGTVAGSGTLTINGCTTEGTISMAMNYSTVTDPGHVLYGRKHSSSTTNFTIDGTAV